jgi:hypothetical protein
MSKKCKHKLVNIISKIPFENTSEFLDGEFVWNYGTDWNLDDRINICVECAGCKKTWQGSDFEDFPKWIQELLEKEEKRFG